MPLTDIQVRNAKAGLRPVKPSSKDQESASPKGNKAKGRTKGKDARLAHTTEALSCLGVHSGFSGDQETLVGCLFFWRPLQLSAGVRLFVRPT
jgi:hypothetical protein